MHVSCKCLNVSIKSRGGEPQKTNIDDIELTAIERADAFFREDVAMVSELEGITKEQPGLVEVRNVGSWVVHQCYNCSTYTHAIHREHGAGLVLININLITSPDEIDKLKTSPGFSPVFRILIDRNAVDDVDLQMPTKFSVSQVSSKLQLALGGLQQQLEESVQREVAITEEKIRAFTAEQYQLLEQFRERAHTEHRLLARLICKSEDTGKSINDLKGLPASPDNVKANISVPTARTVNSRPHLVSSDTTVITGTNIRHQEAPKLAANHIKKGRMDTKCPIKIFSDESTSFDAEVLFTLEGMDDTPASEQFQASDEDPETDDSSHDEGIHIPRGQRGGHPTLAKSLPVTVPAFPSFVHRSMQDQDDEQPRDPLDPHNIRASIKALAKSVHGDTVFGDLPRPRFSTQI